MSLFPYPTPHVEPLPSFDYVNSATVTRNLLLNTILNLQLIIFRADIGLQASHTITFSFKWL